MKKWKQWTGIFLGLSLAVSCVPVIHSQAGYDAAHTWAAAAGVSGMGIMSATTGTADPDGNPTNVSGTADPPDADSGNSLSTIRISVGNGQATPQYQAGQKVDKLTVTVKNSGVSSAQNVVITPVINAAEEWPFEIDSMNYEQELKEIQAGKSTEAIWSDLKVREDVETKSYKLVFRISYDDGKKEYECEKSVYVKTAGTKGNEPEDPGYPPYPPIIINPPSVEQPGDQPSDGQPEEPDQGDMGEGGVYNGDISAVGGGGGSDERKGVPRVIVTGFNTEPGAVNAGSNFRLIVHVKNTSTTTAVSNMLFDFQAPSAGTEAAAEAPAFLPSSGASSIYLDQIPAGETRDVAIDLNARADLVQKPYSINMSMLYEDSNASQYEGSSSLAIPIYQAARFEFSEIELSPASIEVGQEANLMCSLYNTGRVKLYNVKVKFMGDGISAKEVFVGNLDSGATGTIDGMLTGESETMPGTKCKMVVTYEDESGNPSSREEEFEIQVTAPMEMDMGDMEMMGEMPEEAKGFPVIPVVIAAAVILVIVLAVVLTRRRKKKRAQAEEEDLVDEVDRFTEDE
ncbi:COG1361 S-layer family protein [Schaedlerella sp.]|uniref:COG1361 S-layer family protein n=1 Tax=Schaedlerella sp. TaxID=2676057 RepID=UPI003745C4C6|nr:hypothetical protein [Ruminococcus sp.]